MHETGITVAEHLTELPPKAELGQKLRVALLEAMGGLGWCCRRGSCLMTMKVSKGQGFPRCR